ncbi:MAG: nucleotidyltransferase family protein [Deltaproteobacteria bacterium]|nr:nucleotidyltransferase family protein [Deltaproteobacteria bacterium]
MTSPPDPRSVWIRQMAAVPVLAALVDAVGPRRLLPVKGIVTARTLYRDPAERALSDIDVRVSDVATLHEVIAFAEAKCHVVKHYLPAYRTAVLEMHGIDVDVECTVGAPGLCALSVATMLGRATVGTELFGFPCAIPELHDHALFLAVNLFKDKITLAHPWQVEDVIRIAAVPAFDPARFVALAGEARSLAIACVVAEWLAPRSAGWRAVREEMGPRPPRRGYVRLLRWLFAHAPESTATRVLARLASDDRAMRLEAFTAAARYLRESNTALR